MLKWDWSVQHPLQDLLAAFRSSHCSNSKLGLNRQQQLDFLLTAGAFGLVIANNASISGAEGGCQAEVGSASAMSAAALTLAAGGTPYQASQAVCFVIKNMLGSFVIQ